MVQNNFARKAEDAAETASGEATATGATIATQAEDVVVAAREALAEMRRILDEFAATTGEKAGVAGDAVKAAGAQTAERIGTLVDDVRTAGRDGIDQVADQVSKRPITTLAVAAGIGLLVGLCTRPGPRA